VINDILDFSKIEAGRMDIEAHPFDLRECVESALDLVSGRAAEKQLDIAYVFEGELPVALNGDVTRLRQILLNLLSNAVKFTEQGEVVLSVDAAPAANGHGPTMVTIEVRDDGSGAAGTTSEPGGQGLVGMRERVAVLGGELLAGPEPSGGYAVRVMLPLGGRPAGDGG
jgi:K+-sensing histidine kinase KdpD